MHPVLIYSLVCYYLKHIANHFCSITQEGLMSNINLRNTSKYVLRNTAAHCTL